MLSATTISEISFCADFAMLTSALVTIASMNFDSIVDFYTQFLGFAPQSHIPSVYAEFSLAGLRLGIFSPKFSDRSEFGQPSQSGMSLCLEVDSLEHSIDLLARLGYPPPGEITTASHGREIYAYDPDGNRLILHQAESRIVNNQSPITNIRCNV